MRNLRDFCNVTHDYLKRDTMSTSKKLTESEIQERHDIWQSFLKRWPLEKVKAMSLEEYHTANDATKDSFSYWLEFKIYILGSIKGGSAFKFGIYNRRDKIFKENDKEFTYTEDYAWTTRFGTTKDEAFANIKEVIVNIIKFVIEGDLESIEKVDFPSVVKWKLAFLYQPQDSPVMPCIYTPNALQKYLRIPKPLSMSEMYKMVMEKYSGEGIFDFSHTIWTYEEHEEDTVSLPTIPLNCILYGPPGTGKTYNTINKALEILAPNMILSDEEDREIIKSTFDEFVSRGRIRFTTFHQSFSYEDFVEGLRPNISKEDNEQGSISYDVRDGIFKEICKSANTPKAIYVGQKFGNYTVLNVSKEILLLSKPQGKSELPLPFVIIDGLVQLVQEEKITVLDIKNKNVSKKLEAINEKTNIEMYLVNGYPQPLDSIVDMLVKDEDSPQKNEPYVLIIDEINRGNISGVFGELITLIEPSKRMGREEALEAVLPYSRESFGVPENLYIIGTMNTADRSLTGLDIALRRRFTFTEMPPRPDLLEDKFIEASDISLEEVLVAINERIEMFLGRDYCIGHASFMHLGETVTANELKQVFQGTVIPLLEEYFFEDWQKIHFVLNDHKKEDEFKFIRKKVVPSFFDDEVLVGFKRDVWEINKLAFDKPKSYTGIVDPSTDIVFEKPLSENE